MRFGGGYSRSTGLELIGKECDKSDKWRVESPGLCCFVGGGGPALVRMASAIASKSRRLSRISCRRWVVKTDSATLLVGMRPQNLP